MAAVTFTVGAVAAAAAPSAGALVAARFVLGLAVGSAALVVPLYLSEIAPTKIRGAIGSLNQLMIVVGILVAFIVNAILASSGDWRLMLGLAAVPSLVLLVGMVFMPETPRFLVRSGEEDEARDVLEEVTPDAAPADQPQRQIEEIREVDEQERGGGLELLKAPWLRPALVVAIGLAVLQQLVGINTIIYYAPTTLMLVLSEPTSAGDPAAVITLLCLAGFIVSFAATWGPVVWVMLPEVLPLSLEEIEAALQRKSGVAGGEAARSRQHARMSGS